MEEAALEGRGKRQAPWVGQGAGAAGARRRVLPEQRFSAQRLTCFPCPGMASSLLQRQQRKVTRDRRPSSSETRPTLQTRGRSVFELARDHTPVAGDHVGEDLGLQGAWGGSCLRLCHLDPWLRFCDPSDSSCTWANLGTHVELETPPCRPPSPLRPPPPPM